ncbi:MAG: hypothetical protein ACYTG0_06055 [Planctomycetota bacterium]
MDTQFQVIGAKAVRDHLVRRHQRYVGWKYHLTEGFIREPSDSPDADPDGDVIVTEWMWQLLPGKSAVQLYIPEGIKKADAIRLLRKILASLETEDTGPSFQEERHDADEGGGYEYRSTYELMVGEAIPF